MSEDEIESLIDKILVEWDRKSKRWGREVVHGTLIDDEKAPGGFRDPFEELNEKHHGIIDEWLRAACMELTKKKVEDPMSRICTRMLNTNKPQNSPGGNLAMHLITVRAMRSVHWMKRFKEKDWDFEIAKTELIARGIMKKRG
jgi:hypothetical protein